VAGALTVHAFAKINLDLRVLGLRPDGYHELRTTFQSIALADTLTFTKTRGPFSIECDDPSFPADHTNLIWKAAQRVLAIARRREQPSGIHVRVEKNIPMQAGLGGGSSNGAAALRAFCRLWKVKPTRDELQHAAAKLGADVPFFLEGGTALGFHRGDLLVPLDDIDRAWVVVVVPEFGVSTKDAFAWWDEARRDGQDGHDRRGKNISNDLQPLVAKRHPIVGKLVRALNKEGASHASLSGSGSAVFGLFSRRADAQAAARELAGPRTFVTPTLTRAGCRRLAAK
jgi:4-diphosphocytidyl-2-C-methyl-D-erythritol kinase